MVVDATFHASVIISKLPASWEDVRIKLMREEYLPLRALMFRLRSEEFERKVRMAKEALVKDGKEVCWESIKKFNPVMEETGANIINDFVVELKLSKQIEDGLLSLHYDLVQESAPVDTVRFGGENYPVWAHRMELMLKELNVAYVLYEPCPNIARGPEASSGVSAGSESTCEEKWAKDDSLCLRMILFHLSDDLFDHYSKETMVARQLWEEMKVRFGIDRRLVGKYTEFQLIEGRPVVKQVWEFHGICNSLVESGVVISEKFHVSAVISKLPASWKDVSIKLMQEENLPLAVLMDRLIVEEESRGSKGIVQSSEVVAA